MKKLFAQIIKFGAVGFLCFFIDYAIMVGLTELVGIPSLISSGVSYTISTIVNYILSVTVVFDADKEANKVVQFIVFVVLSLIGLGINQLCMWGGTAWLERLMEQSQALAAYSRYAYMVVKIFRDSHRYGI